MKIVLTKFNRNERFYVVNFGYEEISQNAHWEKGARSFYIIHYVLSGMGYFNGDTVNAGEGFLISPGEKITYHSSKDNPWTYFWIIFGGNDADDIVKTYLSTNKNGVFDFDLNIKFHEFVNGIFFNQSLISKPKALGYFWTAISFHEKEIEQITNRYVRQAINIINTDLSISITALADKLKIDDRYLYNLFIKHLRVSPKGYLNELRIERAKTLLLSTDFSVSEIAYSCGFIDVLSFSKFFSKQTGTSPTEYRKTMI